MAPAAAIRSGAHELVLGALARRPADTVEPFADPYLIVRQAMRAEVATLLDACQTAIGTPMARLEVVLRVFDRDCDSIWAFKRKGALVGGLAMLFLTDEGVGALVDGSLNRLDPPNSMLVARHERPAGIYLWSLYSTRRGAGGASHCFARLRGPRYAHADLWSGPNTPDGMRFNQTYGFEPVPGGWPGLHHYRRKAATAALRVRGGAQ